MKRIMVYVIAAAAVIFYTGNTGMAQTGKDKITIGNISVSQSEGELTLRFSVSTDNSRLKKGEWVQVVPVIQAPAGNIELPSIMVSGKRRESFYRRERKFSGDGEFTNAPLKNIVLSGESAKDNYEYSMPVPEGMDGGQLVLYTYVNDGRDGELSNGLHVLAENLKKNIAKPGKPDDLSPDAVTFVDAEYEDTKQRDISVSAYITFKPGRCDVSPSYGNNAAELAKMSAIIAPVIANRDIYKLKSICISGYASPEGASRYNEELAYERARKTWKYMIRNHNVSDPGADIVKIVSYGEDWAGLAEFTRAGETPCKEAVLPIIEGDDEYDLRESNLREQGGGIPYRYIVEHYYPLMRRIEVSLSYEVRALNDEEITQIADTNPEDLNLYEYYRAGTITNKAEDDMYVAAVKHFGDDPVAIINASSVFLKKGDLETAWGYLVKVTGDPRAYNNIGLYYLLGDNLADAEEYLQAADMDRPNAERNLRQLYRLRRQREAIKNYRPVYEYRTVSDLME